MRKGFRSASELAGGPRGTGNGDLTNAAAEALACTLRVQRSQDNMVASFSQTNVMEKRKTHHMPRTNSYTVHMNRKNHESDVLEENNCRRGSETSTWFDKMYTREPPRVSHDVV
jgi:hypothetical protein